MSETLATRGRSHTHLRELIDARAALVHPHERALLLDAADALLFDEPEGDDKLASARLLLSDMVDAGRWMPGPAEDVVNALEGCRAPLGARA